MAHHLEELLENANVVPAINQIEMSPYNYLQRKETLDLCHSTGIVVEAYSPLTKGRKLSDPRLVEMAAKNGKTAAQLLIRWALQKQYVVLPKSVTRIVSSKMQMFSISLYQRGTWLSLTPSMKIWLPAGIPHMYPDISFISQGICRICIGRF